MSEKKGLSFEDRLDVYKQHVGTKYNRETVSRKLGLPKGCITSYTSASVDNIRHYADGIGDLNPRFRDSEYAKTTKYGRLVAPPLFLMGVCFPFEGMMSVPDARAFHSGSEWEFFQPVLEGDKLDFNGIAVASVEARDSRFSGQMLVSTHICEIRNQRGEVVSLAKGIVHRSFSDEVAVSMGKYKDYKPYRYSEEELRKIDEDYDKEVMRGSRPRYWEDVVEGRLIPHVVNGPRTIMDTISWVVGVSF